MSKKKARFGRPRRVKNGLRKHAKKTKDDIFEQMNENIKDSLSGLKTACRNKTFRWLIFPLTGFGVCIGWLVGFKPIEWLILAPMFLAISVTEIINSAIEEVGNVACGEYESDGVKRSKDMASAAVFVCVSVATLTFVMFTLWHITGWRWWEHLI